jgi:hypothetical protein
MLLFLQQFLFGKLIVIYDNFCSLQLRRTNCKNCLVWAKSDDIGREIIKLSKDVIVHCSLFFISLFELSICYLYLGPPLLHNLTGVSYAVGWLCCHGG